MLENNIVIVPVNLGFSERWKDIHIISFFLLPFCLCLAMAPGNIVQNGFDCHTVVNIKFSFAVFLDEINNLLASRPALLGCITRRRRADKRYGI